jgi:hypothetical protein
MSDQSGTVPADVASDLISRMRDNWTRFMTDQWPITTDIHAMVKMAERHPMQISERKLRLFAIACCRRVWRLLPDAASRRLVEGCEEFVEGLLTARELDALAGDPDLPPSKTPAAMARQAALSAVGGFELSYASAKSLVAICAAAHAAEAAGLARPGGEEAERRAQAELLRDVAGDPLRPSRFDSIWLEWQGGLVLDAARGIYEGRRFEELPILADALEEAGCTDAGLLAHLRGPGPHVRGCWALDLVLGKS